MPIKNNNLKQLLNEIKSKSFIYWQKLCENDKGTEIKVKLGKIKDMSKDKVTLSQLANMIQKVNDNLEAFKQETRQNFAIVNDRLDRLEKDVSVLKSDVALIKSCPTIKKEIAELNSSK